VPMHRDYHAGWTSCDDRSRREVDAKYKLLSPWSRRESLARVSSGVCASSAPPSSRQTSRISIHDESIAPLRRHDRARLGGRERFCAHL
jgi:hypothetical protein